jgi:hypothetical protein
MNRTENIYPAPRLADWEKDEMQNAAFRMLLDFGLDNEDVSFSIGEISRCKLGGGGYYIPCVTVVKDTDGTDFECESAFTVFRCICGTANVQYDCGMCFCSNCNHCED